MVARLLSVVIIVAQRSSVIDILGFVYKAFSQCSIGLKKWWKFTDDKGCILINQLQKNIIRIRIKLERPLYVQQKVKIQDNDVESIIYSPYVPCDLWGRIMRASGKIPLL